tara:strand:+ start:213 stop:503 length:291 start_codon:yes stop_codon:yes gene_type:complete
MDKVFTKFEDAGHGWLEVNFEDLIKLDIQNKISNFSYMDSNKKLVYLEEDIDQNLFMKSYKEKYNKGIIYVSDNNEEVSFIRCLPCYFLPSYTKGI